MITPCAITMHFPDHSVPAVITGKVGRTPGNRNMPRDWYVVGHHFGMYVREDQHIGAPEFDPTFSVTWEECEATDEHRTIATNVGERLR